MYVPGARPCLRVGRLMFVAALLQDTIVIAPGKFAYDTTDVLIQEIEGQYVNKVLIGVGLCLAFFDFEHIGESFIHPGDGAAHVDVKFRVLVFRPHAGEVILGTVKSCDLVKGVEISLEFFDGVVIPPAKLPAPARFDPAADGRANSWVWAYEGNELYIDEGETVRFRVLEVRFDDTTTTRLAPAFHGSDSVLPESNVAVDASSLSSAGGPGMGLAALTKVAVGGVPKPRPLIPVEPRPMLVVGSMEESGLGPLLWWGEAEPVPEEEAEPA